MDPTAPVSLGQLVADFSVGLSAADRTRPEAKGRTRSYQPGIGPFSETGAVALVMSELVDMWPERYSDYATGVPYPESPRQKCDLCIGAAGKWFWSVEVKLLRLLGDNGRLNDNMLMHVLSPYPAHRSALTDCTKLVRSSLGARKAILIYAFEAADWPVEPAIDAFERLADRAAILGPREFAPFSDLVHPVHQAGGVYAWELGGETGVE